MKRQNVQGFTLIEIMIVVAIVAILAAVAYPSYTEHVRRSKRAECTGVMTMAANMLERNYSRVNTYVGTLNRPTVCPADAGAATYNIEYSNVAATTFTITATPTGAQTGDRCGNLTLTHTGAKGSTNLTVNECWR